MSFTPSQQMVALLCSVLCGLCIGLLYSIFKVIRHYVFTSKASVFICDFLFMVISAFVSLLFSIGFARGNTRYFILFGEALGFLLMYFTLGRLCVALIGLIITKIRLILKKYIVKFRKTYKRVLQQTR